jgi:hypothetical protein
MSDASTAKLIKDLSKKIDKFQSNVNSRFGKVDVKLDFIKMDVKGVDKHADEIDKRNEKRHNKIMNHVDGLVKGFKKFDEEQVLLSAHSKNHTDRIEKLEKKVLGVVQI